MTAQYKDSFKRREAEVLKMLRKGSRSAFEEIFRVYWRRMFKQAYMLLRDTDQAEEIVQDILTALWVRREELLITNLSYYLHISVKNKVLDLVRSQITKQKYWEYYKAFIPLNGKVTDETVCYDDLMESVEKGTSQLSKKTKTVFHLSRIEGWSVSQIARKLSISEKAVEYHITQSTKVLRVHLKDFLDR